MRIPPRPIPFTVPKRPQRCKQCGEVVGRTRLGWHVLQAHGVRMVIEHYRNWFELVFESRDA